MEWKEFKLVDLCEKVTVGHVGSMADRYIADGIPLLRSQNIKPYFVDYINMMYIDRNFHEKLRKSELKAGDVAVVRTGYPGTACVIPESLGESNCSDLVIIRPGKELNPYFLSAVFNSTFGKSLVAGNLVGAAQQHFNVTAAKELKLKFPPRKLQDKIAAVLSSYDELIGSNNRRITLLEKMAEEIYREWFVRFRFPGYKTTEFEKGIPKKWEKNKAENFFYHVKGKSYTSEEITEHEESMPFITLKSFNRGGGYREEGLKHYSGKFRTEQLVTQGDVVMAVTDMTQEREVVGRVARIPNIGEKGAVISLDVIKLVPKTISNTFLYSYMKYSGFGDFIKTFANGANVLHLQPNLVTAQEILVPPSNLRDAFDNLISPIHLRIDALKTESKILHSSKNLLLPRLMSGKLSVENLNIQFPPGMLDSLTN